jgi:two-component system phosphate regulon sensor histidine kinase PhoR
VQARTARLRDANAELGRANLELSDLVARREQWVLDVSHDLRTPLTSIKGASDNLLDGIAGALTGDQREYVGMVGEHADRLITSIGRLIDAARGAPELTIEERPVDLGALAREVARGLEPIASERRVTLDVDVRSLEVRGDPAHLRAILENLIGNALKYTEAGGRVRVEVAPADDGVRIRVEDDGVGIAPEALSRIFERFYRARPDRPGTGLGLAITRDLVRLHRGDITVQSELGAGSAFDVVLPRRAA